MDHGQSSGHWSLLLEKVGLSGGLLQDSALSDENNVLTAELLLQFTNKSKI